MSRSVTIARDSFRQGTNVCEDFWSLNIAKSFPRTWPQARYFADVSARR